MEIAIRLVRRFTSAWCGGLDLVVLSPAGEVAPFLLGRCLEVSGPCSSRGWEKSGISRLPMYHVACLKFISHKKWWPVLQMGE